MIASTWFDLVVGIDIHVVGIPAPPSPVPVPTPVPMPFVGMVFDPVGCAVGAAIHGAMGAGPGLVLVNGLPATNCGTNVTNLLTLPHLPAPGVTFIPPPKPSDDAELFFGSDHVTLGGSLGVRLGDVALSCSDPVRLPTSVVIAIPKGRLVLNTPPMVPDMNAIAFAAAAHGAMKALSAAVRGGAKLFRQLRQVQKRSGTWRRASEALHQAVDNIAPQRWRDRLKRASCFVTGHPVDVATGRVFTNHVDFQLPGPLPLVFERVYSSSLSWRDGPLGRGWSHSLDQAVWMERGKVVYLAEDGREIEFLLDDLKHRVIRPGDRVYESTNRLTLHALGGFRWEIETHDGIVHEFAPVKGAVDPKRAKLLRIRSADGHHAIELMYDPHGSLDTVRDCEGRLVLFSHDAKGKLVEIKLPLPYEPGWIRHVGFEHNGEGDLVRVLDAKGKPFEYEYLDHLLVRETNRNGVSFYFHYDGIGHAARCVRTWGDGGIYDHEISYDRRNRKTFVENSLGQSTIYTMDSLLMVQKVTDPHGKDTTYAYDPRSGEEASRTGPLGTVNQATFDGRGNCTSITGPGEATVTIAWDERNLPVSAVDETGGTWGFKHDSGRHLIEIVTPENEVIRCGYERGYLAWFGGADAQRTTLEHDREKKRLRVRAPNGAVTEYIEDNRGRSVKVKDARGGVRRAVFDVLDNLLRVTTATGLIEERGYDDECNLTELRNANRHVRWQYGGYNWLIAREEASTSIQFERDTEGQMTGVVNEKGERYGFKLDPCGRVAEEIGFDGTMRRWYQRDAEGDVRLVRHLPSMRTTAISYDAAKRIRRLDHSDKAFVELARDKDGAVLRATNESGTVTFTRDAMRRAVLEATEGFGGEAQWIASRFGAGGRRELLETSLGGRMAILRDAMGDVAELHVGQAWAYRQGNAIGFERDAMGLELARRLPGGVRMAWQRDLEGRPTERRIERFVAGAPAFQLGVLSYQWHGEDQIAAILEGAQEPTLYRHDARGRLVGARLPDGEEVHRAMDVVGNIYRKADLSDRTYAAGGRLQHADSASYRFDHDGNLIEKKGADARLWTYAWNGAGLLREVTLPDKRKVRYEYDAFARRMRKLLVQDDTTSGTETIEAETRYVWDGDVVVHEISTKDGVITWHWEPDTFAPIAKEQGGKCWSIACDHLGTPTEMFDEMGQLAWKMQLDVFGVASFEKGKAEDCPWRWPGQYEDRETGLHYNRYRYYDTSTAQYTSRDPLGILAGAHLYAYPPDPLLWIDPWGLSKSCTGDRTKPTGASGLPLVLPGTKEWDEALRDIAIGRGKGPATTINYRTQDQRIARQLLEGARPGIPRRKSYTGPKPNDNYGFEYHLKDETSGASFNNLQHIKWYDWRDKRASQGVGHIFFDSWT